MSPRNWSRCPQCNARREHEIKSREKIIDEAESMPGKEFNRLIHEIIELKSNKLGESLREYHDIGMTDNEFFVRYHCSCDVCGFSFEFPPQRIAVEIKLGDDE